MLQFNITNLQVSDINFEVPSAFGKWDFEQAAVYSQIISRINNEDIMGNTYFATNAGINFQSSINDLEAACDEIIDICLVLSFINARCVAPSSTTTYS
ncbi:hypothetical protein [Methylobacterium indicum]|uniref:Uncharacterized protein n=1 Tax=Methylobacterium indicum TaxID=1775910 RepID=A0A8H8X0V9_9HYPH|nr:hypothetical protein [Methylobacterium indicum]BCM88058.1 hypothetical protein mvi_65190 [Methylobacterium indicum]